MSYLDVVDLTVEYEKGKPVLENFSLSVEQGELVSLLGPSGCGKTTTLRTIAGFIDPVSGKIVIAGRDHSRLPPNKRDIGLVFQSYALFPHLTVFDNIAFGLRMRRVSRNERKQRVEEALNLVNLPEFSERRPAQLSGGQRQRVALARAIVIQPQLLMFDEPLSNLDAKLRISMRTEIRRLQQRLGTTTVYVTHDQVEALAISDRVVVMNHGEIEQSGAPEDVFDRPQTPFVAGFMGFDNYFPIEIESRDGQQMRVRARQHTFDADMSYSVQSLSPGEHALAYFRSSAAKLSSTEQPNSLPGTVLLRTFQGINVEYVVETEMGEFNVLLSSEDPRFGNENVHVVLPSQSLIVLPAASTDD